MALAVSACAAQPKTAWPEIPPPEPMPEEPAVAIGGPLIEGHSQPPGDKPLHQGEPELPRDVVRNATRTLVLRWPLPTTGVTSLYGTRTDPLDGKTRSHHGVDLEAEYGAVVAASADGVVVWAGWKSGHGRYVLIEHIGGYQTAYAHLSQVLALPNALVTAGQAIGLVGNSGRSTGPHLHFEVLYDGRFVDPLDVLGVPVALE